MWVPVCVNTVTLIFYVNSKWQGKRPHFQIYQANLKR